MLSGIEPLNIFFEQIHCYCEVILPQFTKFAKGIEAILSMAQKAIYECSSCGLKNLNWLIEAV